MKIMGAKNFRRKIRGQLRPSGFRLIAVTVVIVLVGVVVALCHKCQSLQEQLILEQANASVLRQDCQRMQRELDESWGQAFASKGATRADASEASCAQIFHGTLHTSSYRGRALEVGMPPSMFPEADVLLLYLEASRIAIGYTTGDSMASGCEVALIRVPDGLGASGESVSIEVDEPVFWASDVSGQLWDLDLSGLQSLKVSSIP